MTQEDNIKKALKLLFEICEFDFVLLCARSREQDRRVLYQTLTGKKNNIPSASHLRHTFWHVLRVSGNSFASKEMDFNDKAGLLIGDNQ